MATTYANQDCIDPAHLKRSCDDAGLPSDWYELANVFRLPTGRTPGAGQILLSSYALGSIDLTADHSLVFTDGINPVRTLQRITLLRARCVTPNWADDPTSAFLCDVVDRRWHLARIPINRAYNVKAQDGTTYLAATTQSGCTPYTWSEVVQDLFTILGLGTSSLPFTPDGTPENLVFFGRMAWDALSDVLDRIACTLRYDWELDTFAILRLGDTSSAAALASTSEQTRIDALKTWDGYWVEPNRGILPEKVRVLFTRRPTPTTGASIYYSVDVTLDTATGVASGSYVQVHDDMTAIGSSGTPSNAAALQTRADERATDWRRKRVYADNHKTVAYRDYQRAGALLGESIEVVVFDGRGGGMRTELMSAPNRSIEDFRAFEPPWTPGTGSSACPTTTTSPPCTGSCSWSYSAGTKLWTSTSDTCSSGCGCYYPDFCPTCSGSQTTKTSCFLGVEGPGDHPQCNTTTTTTAPPGCSGSCGWKSYPVLGWVQTSGSCLPSCPCAVPAGTGSMNCGADGTGTATTPCVPPPPPPPCSGNCLWVYGDAGTGWIRKTYSCTGGDGTCYCAPPTGTAACGNEQYTPCTGNPGTGTTTTAPPLTCVGRCYWCWSGSAWTFDHSECLLCACSQPGYSGTAAGEVGITACTSVTTTTTTTTTSTTTTTTTSTTTTAAVNCYVGDCTYVCQSGSAGSFALTQCDCWAGSCKCPSNDYVNALVGARCASEGAGAVHVFGCAPTGAYPVPVQTCTTSTTTTTTTAPPGSQYYCCCTGGVAGCVSPSCPGTTISGPYADFATCMSAGCGGAC